MRRLSWRGGRLGRLRTIFFPAALSVCALAVPATEAGAANDPLRSQQYGLDIVESDAAHSVTTGRGAVVAIVDSGVRASHQDLQGRLLPGHDFVDDDSDPNVGAESDGHGTHVLGIAGANEGNGLGVSSVAPGAMYMPVRVLDDDGAGFSDDVAQGIDFAVAHGAHVINLSLGDQIGAFSSSPEFSRAIDRALAAGRVVVAAAGNTGLPVCEQPSAEKGLLCVGSVDENRRRSVFSSFGSGLGVMAPGGSALLGRDIISAFNESDASYTEMAGTSQAAPHVAGVAALLVSKGLRGRAVVQRILATATDAGPSGPDAEYGAGIVNARRAVTGLGSGQAGGGSTGSGASVSVRRRQRIRTVLRRGIRVRCRASGAGRCKVGARTRTRGRPLVAAGSRRLGAGRRVVVAARLNRRGRRLARRALRAGRRVPTVVRVRIPGAPLQKRRVLLLPR
jgi:serine protease